MGRERRDNKFCQKKDERESVIENQIAEVGIYKRKQEIKKARKQELDQESDQENKKTRKKTRTRPKK